MIHCLFLHRFRIGFVVEYWIGEVVLCMCNVVVVISELLRSRHNLRSRSGGSILSVKGLASGVWVSELLLLLMLNRSVMRKVNLGAVLRKNWWDYHPDGCNLSKRLSPPWYWNGLAVTICIRNKFGEATEKEFLFYTHLRCTRYHHINMPKNVGECTPLIQ